MGQQDDGVQWLSSIPSCSAQLFSKFQKDVTVHLLNQSNTVFRAAFSEAKEVTYGTYLYQRVLLYLLDKCTPEGAWAAQARRILVNNDFQMALLLCAVEIVASIMPGHPKFPLITLQLGHLHHALDLWEAMDCYRLCYTGPQSGDECPPMPIDVAARLTTMYARIVEELVWCNQSTLYTCLQKGGGGSREEGDYSLVKALLACTKHWAVAQTAAISKAIQMDNEELRLAQEFSQESQQLVCAVLDQRLDVLFGQHLSNVVACCVYATARLLDVVISFKRITSACMEVSTHVPSRVFKTAQLQMPQGEDEEGHIGDTRQYYNTVFLPRVEDLLRQPQRAATVEKHAHSTTKTARVPLKALTANDMNRRHTDHKPSRLGWLKAKGPHLI